MKNQELPPHLQWPPPPYEPPMVEKIFLAIALGAALIGFIIWAIGIWSVPLNPAG